MTTIVQYSAGALASVLLVYLFTAVFLGTTAVNRAMFPMALSGGVASAAIATAALQVLNLWPHGRTVSSTGIMRGALVVVTSHLFFGIALSGYAGLVTENPTFSVEAITSLFLAGLNVSIYSLVVLPGTLTVGCLTGVLIEKRRQNHRIQGHHPSTDLP